MKKSELKKARIPNRSKMAIAGTATMAALPMLGLPTPAKAQQTGMTTTISAGDKAPLQHGQYLKFADRFVKIGGAYSIAGVEGEHIVYRKAGGEFFFIEPTTGDMRFVSTAAFNKYTTVKNASDLGSYTRKKLPGKMKSGSITVTRATPLDEIGCKFSEDWLKDHREDGSVNILGVDAAGHDVLRTNDGETVYLDSRTGDFVPVR